MDEPAPLHIGQSVLAGVSGPWEAVSSLDHVSVFSFDEFVRVCILFMISPICSIAFTFC